MNRAPISCQIPAAWVTIEPGAHTMFVAQAPSVRYCLAFKIVGGIAGAFGAGTAPVQEAESNPLT
jgi:hypothetical protein